LKKGDELMNAIRETVMNGDLWTALGGISFAGLAVVVWGAVFRQRAVNRRWAAVCLGGVVMGLTGTVLFASHPNDVVVLDDGVALLVSPFEGAEAKVTLASGEKLRFERRHGDYAYVRTEAGEGGWVEGPLVSRPLWSGLRGS
jgi:hypothetical protein